MEKTEVRITGYGGQGVILSAYIIGKAASIYDNKNATMTQSFGPEARGSACSAQLIVSDKRILYPYLTQPNILIAMSQEGYKKYETGLDKNGVLIIEQDLVKPPEAIKDTVKIYSCPATRIAENLGRKLVLNIVMVGFFTKVTKLINVEAMKEAVKTSVPKGTESLNLKAFEAGFNFSK